MKNTMFYKQKPSAEKFNPKRKLFHLLGLIIPIVYYYNGFGPDTRNSAGWLVFGLGVLMVVVDMLRFASPGFAAFFKKSFGALMKAREEKKFSGTVAFLLGCGASMLLYEKEVAILTVFFLLFGDPSAAFFGGKFGELRLINGKSFVGMLACIAGCIGSGLAFIYWHEHFGQAGLFSLGWGDPRLPAVLGYGALSAAAVELVTGNRLRGLLDDNLTIPIVSGFIMSLCL